VSEVLLYESSISASIFINNLDFPLNYAINPSSKDHISITQFCDSFPLKWLCRYFLFNC
jgi:hypothetical protein